MDTYINLTTENSEEPFLVLEDQKIYSYPSTASYRCMREWQ
jgi:hypothetical protein